jgi:hypothetical protein
MYMYIGNNSVNSIDTTQGRTHDMVTVVMQCKCIGLQDLVATGFNQIFYQATSNTLKTATEPVSETSGNHILTWLSAQEHFIECKCHWILTSTIIIYVKFKQ